MSLLIAATTAMAGPGMWVPLFIDDNIDNMVAEGLTLTADQIYDANNSSLKDAVMIFGGGCTGEMVSDRGLILTNYHCGEGAVSSLSSPQTDYMAHGFTARDEADELPCAGLQVRHLVRMEDVSGQVKSLSDTAAVNSVVRNAEEGGKYEAEVEEMFHGNQHILMVYEVFRDVRLVVAPPQALGRFGGETDNWVWPRHTADFTLFRVYAGADNKPADYSPHNKPYRPARHLKTNIAGVREGDFAMVMGFPGSTDQYLTATAIESLRSYVWPSVVSLRQAEMTALEKRMKRDRKTAIDYSAHYSSIANGKKRTAGEIDCTARANTVGVMRAQQARFRRDAQMDSILGKIDEIFSPQYTSNMLTLRLAQDTWSGSRTLRLAYRFAKELDKEKPNFETLDNLATDFFSHSDAKTEQRTLAAALEELRRIGAADLPKEILQTAPAKLSRQVTKGVFGSHGKLQKAMSDPDTKKIILSDPATRLALALIGTRHDKTVANQRASNDLHNLKAAYAKRLSQIRPDSLLAPDANFTMRIAYGRVEAPRTGIENVDRHFTTARGILAKNATGNPDFALPDSLKTILSGGYDRWADADGQLHTCFVGSIHTTGGNSGSPTLNSRGELIGLNFDRIWNGIASDYRFDAERSRNISVDIRYVLFVIDKVCHGGHIVSQFDIVNTPSR